MVAVRKHRVGNKMNMTNRELLELIVTKVGGLETRFDGLETRFDGLETEFRG